MTNEEDRRRLELQKGKWFRFANLLGTIYDATLLLESIIESNEIEHKVSMSKVFMELEQTLR